MLIVGGGPSRTQYDFIKNYKGQIMATDVSAHELIDNGINPDYVTWLETDEINVEFLIQSIIPRMKQSSVLVYRYGRTPRVSAKAHEFKIHTKPFACPTYVIDVGLFSIVYCQQALKIPEIHLLGMEHYGDPYSDNWHNDMIQSFERYMANEQNEESKIIDHSINGKLRIHNKEWYSAGH